MPESVAPQFATAHQQRDTATFGIWIFLATEVMFFGGLIMAYFVDRLRDPAGFIAAARHTDLLLGTLNTAVLLTSSGLMAAAALTSEARRPALCSGLLVGTAALGGVFLVLKGIEYADDIARGLAPGFAFDDAQPNAAAVARFFFLYFALTGIHALHLVIGITATLVAAVRCRWRGHVTARLATQVEITGLYWHFVDIAWIFLYPLLYLAGRS
jgi:cytochrome c oxidase subunit 3